MKKYVHAQVLTDYAEQIVDKYGLSDNFKTAIISQIMKMRDIYGDKIPRDDFLQLFNQQIEALRSGYKKTPVDIEEFLLSKEYLNVSNTIRPKIKETLIDIFGNYNYCYEITMSGCIDLDAYIMEGNGNLRKLKDIANRPFSNVSVCGEGGFEADGGSYSGVKEVREITLQNGRKLKLTPDHRVEVLRGDNVVWEEAQNITTNDFVRCPRYWPVKPENSYGEDFGFFIGCWVSCGESFEDVAKISSSNRKSIFRLAKILTNMGFSRVVNDLGDAVELEITTPHKSKFLDLLAKFGLLNVPNKHKQVPPQILMSDNNTMWGFLQGVWETLHSKYLDGISHTSKEFIIQLQHILLRFGAQSIISIEESQDDIYWLKVQSEDVYTYDFDSMYIQVTQNRECKDKIATGDIEVYGKRKFVANGMSVHNSTRWGKTYLACCAFAYHVYKLSCLYNPQTHYKLAPGSEIVFVFQSVNEKKAKRNFREFRGMIESSEYFKNYFFPKGKSVNYSTFPNNITVKPVPANNTAVMSENVFCAFIDEANFMKIVKGSTHQGTDEEYYDQATQLYTTIKNRIQNQFKDFDKGEWPGKLYLASSANHTEDFIQQKKEEARKSNHIYVADYALWEVKEDICKSGKYFWVQMPTETDGGQILDEKPDEEDNVIAVPVELRDQFEENLHDAIRNVAGKPLARESKFIPSSLLTNNIKSYNEYYNAQQIFTVQEVEINSVNNLTSLVDFQFIDRINQFGKFHSHLDMAVQDDSAGLAIGATMGSVSLETKLVYNKEKDAYEKVDQYSAPLYVIFGLLRINPPDKGQIEVNRVQALYAAIKDRLTNLTSFTADRAYSISLIQNLRKIGIRPDYLSVDRNANAYIEMRSCLSEGRLWLPEHLTFKNEIKNLNYDAQTGKVDHGKLVGKDVADSVAGTVFKLSNLKRSWSKKGNPPTLQEMARVTQSMEKEQLQDVKRPSSGNRPRGWQKRKRTI